ncbi:unnamed protein product [Hymenolepis diminuta]|uniref:Uncharacterized protein n=1 Tax=Hymenolepis diminuta TaxID=6216 RepID=A0A3P6WD44_HYMDI|nr:unnamed protein product [Hymenolepis diminuta]
MIGASAEFELLLATAVWKMCARKGKNTIRIPPPLSSLYLSLLCLEVVLKTQLFLVFFRITKSEERTNQP